MSDINSSRRNRVSEKALKATIRAMTETGLTISKVVIQGSQIEIFCGDQVTSKDEVELTPEDRANGLEPW